MAKRLVALVGTLVVLLAAAVPALAQQGSPTLPVGATGDTKTVNFELTVEGTPPADSTFYAQTVQGAGVFLTDPEGDGIYTGSFTFATANFPEGIPFMIVQATGTRSTPLGERPGAPQSTIKDFGVVTPEDGDTLSASVAFEGDQGSPTTPEPVQGTSATFDFELTVKGQPLAGTRFFGVVPAEGCISVPLTDPDGDGVYTGSLDVPRFPPGPVPPDGAEPVSLPVRIVQADSGASPCNPTRVIKDFGTVPANDDTFKARVNFKGGPVSPKEPSDECLTVSENPEECEEYVAPGGSDSGGGGSGGSGSDDGSSASNGGSSGSGSNSGSSDSNSSGSGGSGNDAESSGLPGGVTDGIRGILPSTGGGMALWVLGAGILLVGGGLLVRRIFR
jgi:LPXTG-motif cell wall-anchored protein